MDSELRAEINASKRRYVERLMHENEEIAKENGLNDEQIEALEWLCGVRHHIHTNWDAFWDIEDCDSKEMWGYIDSQYDSEKHIDTYLESVGLQPIGIQYSAEKYGCSIDGDELGLSEDELEDERVELNDMLEEVNSKIEHYLHSIDEQYGTSYEPTGATRI